MSLGYDTWIIVISEVSSQYEMLVIKNEKVYFYAAYMSMAQIVQQCLSAPRGIGSRGIVWAPKAIRDIVGPSTMDWTVFRDIGELAPSPSASRPLRHVPEQDIPWEWAPFVAHEGSRKALREWLLPEAIYRCGQGAEETRVLLAINVKPFLAVVSVEMQPYFPRQVVQIHSTADGLRSCFDHLVRQGLSVTFLLNSNNTKSSVLRYTKMAEEKGVEVHCVQWAKSADILLKFPEGQYLPNDRCLIYAAAYNELMNTKIEPASLYMSAEEEDEEEEEEEEEPAHQRSSSSEFTSDSLDSIDSMEQVFDQDDGHSRAHPPPFKRTRAHISSESSD